MHMFMILPYPVHVSELESVGFQSLSMTQNVYVQLFMFNCSCTAPVRVHVHEDVCAHVLDPVQVHTHVLVRVHVCIYFQDLKRSPTPECVRKTAEPTFSFFFFTAISRQNRDLLTN